MKKNNKKKKFSLLQKILIGSSALIALQLIIYFLFRAQIPQSHYERALLKLNARADLAPETKEQARLQLAIGAFEKKYFRVPQRLTELVPEFLTVVPTNPSTSKPFEYTIIAGKPYVGEVYDKEQKELRAKKDKIVIENPSRARVPQW